MATKTKTKKKPNKNPTRKEGQIWRVGRGNGDYPFYSRIGSEWEIIGFESYDASVVVLWDIDREREYRVMRRHLTTSKDKWSYVGEAKGGEKPWTVFCQSCSSARVVIARRRPVINSCSFCGVR